MTGFVVCILGGTMPHNVLYGLLLQGCSAASQSTDTASCYWQSWNALKFQNDPISWLPEQRSGESLKPGSWVVKREPRAHNNPSRRTTNHCCSAALFQEFPQLRKSCPKLLHHLGGRSSLLSRGIKVTDGQDAGLQRRLNCFSVGLRVLVWTGIFTSLFLFHLIFRAGRTRRKAEFMPR